MNWKTVKISDVGNIVTGKTPSTKVPAYYDNGDILFIGPSDLSACSKHVFTSDKHITIEGRMSLGNNVIPKGAVCVSCIGTIGYVGVSDSDCATNQQINSIIVKDGVDADFIYYVMRNMWNVFKSLEGQSTTLSILNKSHFANLEIQIPPLETQRRIAAILSSLDDKIENNNRINRNLEAQAQALFKSWFVDFEPFGGTMPEDWKEYELGEFLPVITGKKDANIASKTGKYPFFSCAQDILYTENYSFNADAILVAGNGDFNVKWYRGKFEAYQRTYVLIPKDSRYLGWLYYMVKHNLNNITCGARGSVIKFITKGNLENFRFAAPKDLTKCDIIDKFNVINQTIESKKAESQRLAALRDTLLPKLMRGEIAV